MATVRRNGLALAVLLVRATLASPYLRPRPRPFATATGNGGTEKGSPEFWYHLAISVVLVLAGGVFAGYVCCIYKHLLMFITLFICSLTLGLMGLDELHLRVLATSSENLTEKRNAQKGEAYLIWHVTYSKRHKFLTCYEGEGTGFLL